MSYQQDLSGVDDSKMRNNKNLYLHVGQKTYFC